MTSTLSRSVSSPLSRRTYSQPQTSNLSNTLNQTIDPLNLSDSFPSFVYTTTLVTIISQLPTSVTKENQQILLNSYSSCRRLLDHLKANIGIQQDEIIDLMDNEGKLKELNTHSDEYASQYLTPRNTYYVLRVETDSSGDKRYTAYFKPGGIDPKVNSVLENSLSGLNKAKAKSNPRSFKQNPSSQSGLNTTGGRKRPSAKK